MSRTAVAVEPVDFQEWDELRSSMGWKQGEHFALVGPTNAGKTTAALSLCELRDWVLLLSTKPADSTLSGLKRRGWATIKAWPPKVGQRRVIVHAPLVELTDGKRVGKVVGEALSKAYRAGAWTLLLDDLQALNDTCGLHQLTRTLLLNARSSGITVVASTQRPRWVPREVWTQSTHLLIWKCVDRDDLRALSGLGNSDTDRVRAAVQSLDWDRHECLYVNTRTGRMVRTILPPPPK